MKLITRAFLLILACSARADAQDYLAAMIACEEKEERFVEEAYDAFNLLAAGHDMGKAGLRLPAGLTRDHKDMITFERAFYLTPNIFRGFALRVPQNCLRQSEGLWVSTVPLTVAGRDSRQGVTTLTLKSQSPNQ